MSTPKKTNKTVSLFQGEKRRRTGATYEKTGRGGRRCPAIPSWYTEARGHRFPKEPATLKQLAELRNICCRYIRNVTALRFDVSAEMLGKVFGLEERQAKTVRTAARELTHTSAIELAKEVLQGMASGRIAGILGTPKSKDHRFIFEVIYHTDRKSWRSEMPQGFSGRDDGPAMRMFHAAFCLEYQEWLSGST